MTYDEAINSFMPGHCVNSVHQSLVKSGWNDKFAQLEMMQIAKLGASGKTAFLTLNENVKHYGISTAKAIDDIRQTP